MIIAAAQTLAFPRDIAANIADHCAFIEQAAAHKAQLIVFPEMSISGYDVKDPRPLAFMQNDPRVAPLRKAAIAHNMIVAAGAPVAIGEALHIGLFIFLPTGEELLYTKQYVHFSEAAFFTSCFDHDPQVQLGEERISFAICADLKNPLHAEAAAKRESTLYVASIFYTPDSIEDGHARLAAHARTHNMNVLMANFLRSEDAAPDDMGSGRSAFWSAGGEMIASLGESERGLLLITKDERGWSAKPELLPETHTGKAPLQLAHNQLAAG